MTMRGIAFRLVLVLIFTIPWEQTLELPGRGTVSKLVGLAAAAAWVVTATAEGRHRRPDRFHAAFFLMVVWSGLTVFWSVDPRTTVTGFLTLVQMLVLLLIIWDLVDTRARAAMGLQAYVLGAFVSIGGIVVNFLNNDTTVWLRYSPPGFDVDGAGFVIALGMPAAIYLAVRGGARRWSAPLRLLNFAYVPAAILAIVLTGTRTAAIACIPVAIFAVFYVMRARPAIRLMAAAALGCGIWLLISVAPPASLERIASTTQELSAGGDSLSGRTGIWRESVDVFLERPLIGIGQDAHRAAVPSHKVAHNTPLSIATEMGLVGLVLFGNIIIRLARRIRGLSGWDARLWSTQLAVVVIGSLTLSVEDRKAVWAFVGLALSSAAAAAVREEVPAFARRTFAPPGRGLSAGRAAGERGTPLPRPGPT